MRSYFSFALLAATAALAAACASQPDPEPTPVATAPVTTPRPAPTAPTTTPTAPAPMGAAAGSRADFMAKNTDRVYFELDQYTLDDSDRRVLQGQAQWLGQFPTSRVQIEGHADERGTREYNLALGARRADAVASYLSSLGVTMTRIETVSFGKDKPINAGHDEAAWSQNRNAHTNVVSGATS
ncbi:MAG: peptidoglycan-associated lipoprotein Pal [Alphaproteobacteria bacterium]|nr:peptidoglycan-associated lipoprotein Pal [Alphaproteobacteria bacterium]